MWKARKKRPRVIGRLYTVSVRQVERHCLRLLLINVKGATSFQHLQTVDGVESPTFKLAAIALNLLEDDRVCENTMTEAATYQMPYELRQLSVYICLYRNPADPLHVLESNMNHLMEDYMRGHEENVTRNFALKWIQDKLHLNNQTMEDLSLPNPDFQLINRLIQEQMGETDENTKQEKRLMGMLVAQFNDGQRSFLDQIMASQRRRQHTPPTLFSGWSLRNGEELSKEQHHHRTPRPRKICHRCCFNWNRLYFTDWRCHLSLPVQALPSNYRDHQIQDLRRELLCTTDQKS